MEPECRTRYDLPPADHRGRVLVAHGNAEARAEVRAALQGANCDVVEAGDGSQAYVTVLATEIDVAVIDLDMEPGSGLDFIASLTILPIDCVRPEVIVWSDGVGTPEVEARLAGVRVATRLKRSADLAPLLAAIDAVLDDPLQFVQER